MKSDNEVLATLNDDIAKAETRGDKAFFETLLAPVFAMRRANGKTASRDEFIKAVGPSAPRATELESVTLLGANRATVSCLVSMDTDQGAKRFHNLRLFVRADPASSWLLLAWANEPAG